MAEGGAPSPVAEAAEWLARRGVPVPVDSGGSASEGGVIPERTDRRRSGRRRGRGEDAGPKTGPDDPDADPYAVARTIALRKLTAQSRTRHELAQALQRRDVPDEVADSVLDRLQEVGLVDDGAFAETWVESRQRRRHLSGSALRRELRAKGVEREQIDAALESIEPGDELAAARELARKRVRALAGLPHPVRYRRLAGVLTRRGFGSGIVSQVLQEVFSED